MDEGKEEQGGGTVDKPYITVVVERATFLIWSFNSGLFGAVGAAEKKSKLP